MHNRSQPPTNFGRFVVHAIRERMTKSLHACSLAFHDRLTPEGETTVTASLAADVRKTKEYVASMWSFCGTTGGCGHYL
jgi:hypothetical protein